MDVAREFARTIISAKYENIPPKVVEITKRAILDTLGCICAGSTAAGIRETVELVKETGGRQESSIIAHGVRVPAFAAAFANGSMCHALHYDDVHDASAGHPSAMTAPGAFAVAERIGKVNGKEFVTALCLGIDMHIRMGLAARLGTPAYVWNWPAIYGPFGTAAACGRLLGLTEEQIESAFGLILSQVGGSLEPYMSRSLQGVFSAGFTAQAGVWSTLLAQKGISGVKSSLEGRAGLYNAYFGGKYDREALTAGLGNQFETTEFRIWPCTRGTHGYIEATLNLRHEHDIQPLDIEKITVFCSKRHNFSCEPLEERRNPGTRVDASTSLPWAVAVAAARGKVTIEDYSTEHLKDPEILQLTQKIVPAYDPGMDLAELKIPGGSVEIRTKGGKTYFKRIDVMLGSASRPISKEQHIEKFRDCLTYSARPVPIRDADSVIEMIDNLEELDDFSRIIRLLA